MEQEKIKRAFRAFRIISIISAAGSAMFLMLALMTFVPMIFIRENLTVEAGGLLGFFLDVINEGKNEITSADLVLAVLPRFVQLLLFFAFSLRASFALKKGEKAGALGFPGVRRALSSLSVISFLTALLSSVLTRIAQNSVSKDFFNITATSNTGWVVLGLVLLFASLIVKEKENHTGYAAGERQKTE